VTDRGLIKRSSGFTLAEVLVALAVLSVGLLGAAALAVDTVQSQHRALLRAQAQRLAGDLAERMRGNRAGLSAYQATPAEAGCVSTAVPARRCTPDELARHELAAWSAELGRALPDGRGAVVLMPAGAPARFAITVRWRWRTYTERFALEGWL
jgi:type IV pilus assembly protein PilV